MSHFHINITPRDPVVVRDGRPFGDGQQKMRPLDWPYPQLVAGAIRTMAGKAVGAYRPEELNSIHVRGPLPVRGGTLYLPVPADLILDPHRVPQRSRPQSFPGAGCNLPAPLTLPCALPLGEEFKPTEPPPFWSRDAAVKWLTEKLDVMPGAKAEMSKPCRDERIHTAIDPETQSAEDKHLFSTTGLSFPEDDSLVAAVEAGGPYAAWLTSLRATHPLGGERRLAFWETSNSTSSLWDCPHEIRTALSENPAPRRIRLTLATPAIWRGGWLPQWATSNQPVPGTDISLRLVGACVPRFRSVSGYSLEAGRRGPKAVRWMAPAGSTYFFETVGDNVSVAPLADLWLKPLPDANETQDQRDGFGLALWGIWKDHEGN